MYFCKQYNNCLTLDKGGGVLLEYILVGDELRLVRWTVSFVKNNIETTRSFFSEEEKENFVSKLNMTYILDEIHQPEYEWLDGLIFENKADIEKAIKLGEISYKEYVLENDLQYQNEQLKQQLIDVQMALIEIYEGVLNSGKNLL